MSGRAVITVISATVICIIIMLLCLLILRGSPSKGKKSKVRKSKNKTRRSTAAVKSVRAGSASSPSSPAPGDTAMKGVPLLKAQPDKDLHKYSNYVKSYLKIKHDTEIRVVGLKKYYSERHGFDCVDFTYMVVSGMSPYEFKSVRNALDTAMTNVSGVNAITFPVEGSSENTYRTTFYLSS